MVSIGRTAHISITRQALGRPGLRGEDLTKAFVAICSPRKAHSDNHAPLIAHELRRQVRVIVERDLGARVAENLRERVDVPALHGEMRRALLLARRFGGVAPYLVGTDSDRDRSLPVGTGEQSHLTEHWR